MVGAPRGGWYVAAVRIAVLASGSGTLLEAILDDGIPVALVVVDRPSRALEVAAAHGVEAVLVERTELRRRLRPRRPTRGEVVDVLQPHEIDLVVMAGFGTIFAEADPRRLPPPHAEHPPGAAARRSRAGTPCATRSTPG